MDQYLNVCSITPYIKDVTLTLIRPFIILKRSYCSHSDSGLEVCERLQESICFDPWQDLCKNLYIFSMLNMKLYCICLDSHKLTQRNMDSRNLKKLLPWFTTTEIKLKMNIKGVNFASRSLGLRKRSMLIFTSPIHMCFWATYPTRLIWALKSSVMQRLSVQCLWMTSLPQTPTRLLYKKSV